MQNSPTIHSILQCIAEAQIKPTIDSACSSVARAVCLGFESHLNSSFFIEKINVHVSCIALF